MIFTFPHLGNYCVPLEVLVKRLFKDAGVMLPPPITKKTLELGARHSPDFVCVPFKYTLGNLIEALDKGANFLFQAGGGCRFGFYGELQEEILKDLGYKFKFVNLFYAEGFSIKRVFNAAKEAGCRVSFLSFINTFLFIWNMVKIMDKHDIYIRKNIGFEKNKNSFIKLQNAFHKELKGARKNSELRKIDRKYNKLFKAIELNKPEKPLRVVLVGELYCLMEQNSTYYIERQLASYGIEIHRDMSLTYLMRQSYKKRKQNIEAAGKYLKYHLGADGTHSVAATLRAAEDKFDGVIHIKPFGCMPEVNAMPILMKISDDYKIPVLYFSFDAQTSETGVKTRIEAFHDMLVMACSRHQS